ncbi:MAG: GGDEF domain-containing protein [Lachnospiraceae bacterium]
MNLELYYIYYIETNTICILLLSFILVAYIREMRGAAEARYYKAEIIEIIVYCVLDMITAIFKGKSFPGAELILQLSNTLYIAFPGIMVLTWGQYIFVHMKKYGFQKSIIDHIFRGLLWLSVVITLTSPFTHFAFYLDEGNIYHRNPGAYVVPVIAYLYMIFDTGKLLIMDRKIDSLKGRRSARNLSIFVIPCIIFSLIQIVFYGCTTAQVGFTMGFMIVYLVSQQNKISKDALTGLNNRREFENQFDNLPKNAGKILITMIDVDSFKSINDTYGHMEGDQAIKTVALVLSRACAQCKNEGDFFLSRYGGDEFVILSKEFNEGADQALFYAIQAELNIVNETEEHPYDLHLSIGTSFGTITGKKDAVEILKKADAEMYKVKKKKTKQRF